MLQYYTNFEVDWKTAGEHHHLARVGTICSETKKSVFLQNDTIMVEYGDWLQLKNVTRYFRTRELVEAQLVFLRQAYLDVGKRKASAVLNPAMN